MTDEEIQLYVHERLNHAREKHPEFACDVKEAILALVSECGEALQEVVKRRPCWEENMNYELIDVITVACRILRGEHKH